VYKSDVELLMIELVWCYFIVQIPSALQSVVRLRVRVIVKYVSENDWQFEYERNDCEEQKL